jgi:hypothetical protein
MTQRYYQIACRSATGALAAVCVASITLAGCAGANVLNGSTAPSLSTSALNSAATSGSPNQSQPVTSTSGTRPYRPNSVIAGLFGNSLHPPTCMTPAAGSSGNVFMIQRFVKQDLCFSGLSTSVPSNLVITTPGGVQETITLTPLSNGFDEIPIFSVPGQGAEASLGKYSFQITTPIPGTTSASPTPSVMPASGYFIVMPDTRPTAEVGSGSTAGARQVYLPAGSQLSIWFSGYPSFSTVYVSLYGPCAAQKCSWLADLPGVKTDQYGEGTASWAIPSSATASLYPIWIDPAPTCLNPCIAVSVTG